MDFYIEMEPEVSKWYGELSDDEAGQVGVNIDRLAEQGVLLTEPYSRQLKGKLRELRFYVNGKQTRISYFIFEGRRIILLTVFRKTRQRETREITRAYAAMLACVEAGHTADEED